MSAVAFGGGREPGEGLRWAAAALLVAGVHVGAGWWLVGHAFAPPPPPEGAAGVTVELEPVSVPVPPTAEPKPTETAGPGEEKQVAEAPDAPPEAPPPPAAEPPQAAVAAPPPPPVETPPPEPAPVEAAAAPPLPVPEVAPPPSPAPSDAVLAPPPRPAPPPKKVAVPKPQKSVKPPPKPDPREVARQDAWDAQAEARQEAREEVRHEARAQAAAEARARRQAAREQARAARAAVAREGGGDDRESAAPVASGAAVANWRGEVVAHLNAYKPASPNGSGGTVRVAFSVDRGGRVVSASVSGSSGDPELDAAAVSMVRRASPVPAPPPEMGGRIGLSVPVRFH
ncbi:energy transducer TonB family protein [Lichenibacterium dinghuense]|uniref:energy transducer TonB family protein n=1 Tax=Lichenibacterium dinghuense TaxID=2895977 RepID=UPI001EFF6F40|nr:energy transducer TonB [Lichenibacterium sp. 6Y81]